METRRIYTDDEHQGTAHPYTLLHSIQNNAKHKKLVNPVVANYT